MTVHSLWQAGLDWLLPCYCAGCGEQRVQPSQPICYACLSDLYESAYDTSTQEHLEEVFWGRIPLQSVIVPFPLRNGSILQHTLHQLKYNHRPHIGRFLGMIAANTLITRNLETPIDAVLPLPLHPTKQRKRGYNQAECICEGIGQATGLPIWRDIVQRTRFTESQTNKDRGQRWANMQGTFCLWNADQARGKHLLLVDDVLTTGATLEACGHAILQIPDIRLSIFALGRTEIG